MDWFKHFPLISRLNPISILLVILILVLTVVIVLVISIVSYLKIVSYLLIRSTSLPLRDYSIQLHPCLYRLLHFSHSFLIIH